MSQPKLADLMARYLEEQAGAHGAGLAKLDAAGEVLPYDAAPVQTVDPRAAWEGATAALGLFTPVDASALKAPSFWSQLVSVQEPAVALAFCAGNYPQLLRDLHLILHPGNVRDLCPVSAAPLDVPGLQDSIAAARGQWPLTLVALAMLRLARHFDAAVAFAKDHENQVPTKWKAAWENEKAALAWHSGRSSEALEIWTDQEPGVPVLFNRGMAALFQGNAVEAKDALGRAVAQLPEAGAWHHLGRLYLALCRS